MCLTPSSKQDFPADLTQKTVVHLIYRCVMYAGTFVNSVKQYDDYFVLTLLSLVYTNKDGSLLVSLHLTTL